MSIKQVGGIELKGRDLGILVVRMRAYWVELGGIVWWVKRAGATILDRICLGVIDVIRGARRRAF